MTNMNKYEMIEDYVRRIDAISEGDINAAKSLATEIIAVYEAEIPNIGNQLDCCNIFWDESNRNPDYIGDIKFLRSILINHSNNIKTGVYKMLMSKEGTHINVSQEQNNSTVISFEQVMENVNHIPDSSLSVEEKEELTQKIASILAAQDKNSKWDKSKGILKWLSDKGVDVAIAVLPYILQAIK